MAIIDAKRARVLGQFASDLYKNNGAHGCQAGLVWLGPYVVVRVSEDIRYFGDYAILIVYYCRQFFKYIYL